MALDGSTFYVTPSIWKFAGLEIGFLGFGKNGQILGKLWKKGVLKCQFWHQGSWMPCLEWNPIFNGFVKFDEEKCHFGAEKICQNLVGWLRRFWRRFLDLKNDNLKISSKNGQFWGPWRTVLVILAILEVSELGWGVPERVLRGSWNGKIGLDGRFNVLDLRGFGGSQEVPGGQNRPISGFEET